MKRLSSYILAIIIPLNAAIWIIVPDKKMALALTLIVLCLLFIYFFIIEPKYFIQWRMRSLRLNHKEGKYQALEFEHKIRTLAVQVLGGTAVLLGLFFTWQNLQLSHEAQMTERFTHAIEQIGNDNTSVRVGGLYALQRLAKDSSSKDFLPVLDIVVSYLREYALKSNELLESKYQYSGNKLRKISKPSYLKKFILDYDEGKFERRRDGIIRGLPLDVYSATSVLRELLQRGNTALRLQKDEELASHIELNGLKLQKSDLHDIILNYADFREATLAESNLQNSVLKYADFENADLRGINLNNSNLEGAVLINATLSEAELKNVNLSNSALWAVNFEGANLNGVNFKNAQLMKAKLNFVQSLKGADFTGADLKETELLGADLSKTIGLTSKQLRYAIYDEYTQFPSNIKPQQL